MNDGATRRTSSLRGQRVTDIDPKTVVGRERNLGRLSNHFEMFWEPISLSSFTNTKRSCFAVIPQLSWRRRPS